MSLVSLLGIARSAMQTYQKSMDVTAHNIANAQTPGYSRQTLEIVPYAPYRTGDGLIGRGVTDEGVARARDEFLDATFRRESGLLSGHATLLEFLSGVEAAANEPSDDGLAAALDAFFGSFADLAADPGSPVAREQVRAAAQGLVGRMHDLAGAIDQANQDALARLQSEAGSVNDLTRRIADLNAEILASGGPRQQAADLQDTRDRLIDELSTKVGVRVLRRDDGTVGILAGDALLVDGGSARSIEVRSLAGGGFGVGIAGGGPAVNAGSGSIRALTTLTAATLPALKADLDALAQALVTEVNAVHRGGVARSGATGVDFFDPAGVTGSSFALAPGVAASTDDIAAGATAAPGDAENALLLASLGRAAVGGLGGATFRDHFVTMASRLGTSVQSARQEAAVSATLAERAEASRQSVSGVSVDEEMVLLIQQQQGFQAAARLIGIANELMDDVLRMI